MDRRQLLTTMAGSAAGISVLGHSVFADEQAAVPSDFYKVTLGNEIPLTTQSTVVVDGDSKFNLIRLGKCRLILDDQNRLTATVKAAIIQYAEVDYWISLAVFDEEVRLLGAATHKEAIQYIRSGSIPTVFQELKFDFGISKAYKSAARLAVSISDRDVPRPGKG